MSKLDQLRALREKRASRRKVPTPKKPAKKAAKKHTAPRKKITHVKKTNGASKSNFNKTLYQRLTMQVRRARDSGKPERITKAETALRKAWPDATLLNSAH